MNVKRLRWMIEILEGVEAERGSFNLDNWATVNECGTTGCAMGYAALDPDMRSDGLRLVVLIRNGIKLRIFHPASVDAFNALARCEVTADPEAVVIGYPTYQENNDFEAAAAFFDILHDTSKNLFHPDRYPVKDRTRPGAVIDRIKALLDGDGR